MCKTCCKIRWKEEIFQVIFGLYCIFNFNTLMSEFFTIKVIVFPFFVGKGSPKNKV